MFIFILLLSFIDLVSIKEYVRQILLVIYCIIMIFISTIRWNQTQGDWQRYYDFFTQNDRLEQFFDRGWEPAYVLLNYCTKVLTDEYVLFMLTAASIVIITKVKGIYKLTPYPFLTLLLNFANQSGDIIVIRQTFAFAITLYSFIYIIDRDKIKFILLVLLASLFHVSAVMFLIAYWIYDLKITKRTYAYIFTLATIFSFIMIQGDALNVIIGYLPADLSLTFKLLKYQTEYEDLATGGNVEAGVRSFRDLSTLFFGGVVRRASLLPILYCAKKYVKSIYTKMYGGLLNVYCVGVITYVLFYNISPSFANRGGYYFTCVEIILIPFAIMSISAVYRRMIAYLILVIYVSGKFFIPFVLGSGMEVPFLTIFD